MPKYGYKVKLFFEDECPRIGSGWRVVTVDDDIDVTTLTSSNGATCRLPTKEYDRLLEATEKLESRCRS